MADQDVTLYLNGVTHKVNAAEFIAGYSLNDYIREKALLKGTKAMCREGGCGVCTVTVQNEDGETLPVNSCLVPLHKCHGWRVTTIEGLGSVKSGYHKIQKDLADKNGSQCGFCSPGMVMTMYGSLQQDPKSIKSKLEGNFDGNICRCTGYRPIMYAMHQCCMDIEDIASCSQKPGCSVTSASQWKTGGSATWYNPKTLDELRLTVAQHSTDRYTLVAGHTGQGVYKHDGPFDVYVDMKGVAEYSAVALSTSGDELTVGAANSLTRLMEAFQSLSSTKGFEYLAEAVSYLDLVANLQIRNMGSWAGNLMMKHKHRDFISDVFTLLECIGVTLNVYDCKKKTSVQMSPGQLLTVDMSGQVVESMVVKAKPGWALQAYKVMPRYRNAHSMLSLAVFIQLDDAMKVLSKPAVVYAGVADDFVHAGDVETSLVGKTLTQNSTIQDCMGLLDKVKCDEGVNLPSAEYRKSLVKSLFYKAMLTFTKSKCKPDVKSGGQTLVRAEQSTGSQDFETDPSKYPVSEPMPKLTSRKQTAGEAEYIGDIPDPAGQLTAVFVKSTIAAGDIQSIDTTQALAMDGVVRVLTYKDVPGKNIAVGKEPLLVETTVEYYGQPVAIVLAESEEIALAARKLVKVTYTNLRKPILTTADAVKAKSFFPKESEWDVASGDAQDAMKKSDIIVSGVVETGEQYAMHMETQVCLAQPQEGHYLLHASTQVMLVMQARVAGLLGIQTNEVEVKVRRAGGGFGAKQSRSVYIGGAAALGAYHTGKPVRMCMTLEDNMEILGRRQPCRIEYQAGVNKDMKIQALTGTVYEDCGFSTTDSMAPAILRWLDSAYFIPNWDVKSFQCKTNQPNHCYVRTPGIISMVHFIEQIVSSVAAKLDVSPEALRLANLYKDGDVTPFQQKVSPCYLQNMWDQVKTSANYEQRSSEITAFNAANKWTKKAITLTPVRYGSAFFPGTNFMVHVSVNYDDASVTVLHGGVELGQGINTKVTQVVAYTLGVPMDNIKVQPTSTTYNSNTGTTGGSLTSDMNCMGVKNACDILLQRMAPHKKDGMTWNEIVAACVTAQVDLHAKYFIIDKEMAPVLQDGMFSYDTFGAACTEIELDVLTGNYIIRKMNVLYDCGTSISPEIDIGQIEGAIIMGIGLLLHEEIKYDPRSGQMVTNNTWNYHVPLNRDIPENFQVNLLRGHPNKAVHFGSKITAEPPFLLAESVVESVTRCIYEFRKENGNKDGFIADAPFTVEKVHMACGVDSKAFIIE